MSSILPSGGTGRIDVRVPAEDPEVLPRARLYYTVKIGDERPFADDPVETEDVIVSKVLPVPIQEREDQLQLVPSFGLRLEIGR